MNMFRNSLNSSLRVLSLRGHSEIGFQSKCWKFFSINNSVQFRKSDGIYTSSNMFDFSEVKDKVGRGEIKDPEFHPGSDIDQKDNDSLGGHVMSYETIYEEGDSFKSAKHVNSIRKPNPTSYDTNRFFYDYNGETSMDPDVERYQESCLYLLKYFLKEVECFGDYIHVSDKTSINSLIDKGLKPEYLFVSNEDIIDDLSDSFKVFPIYDAGYEMNKIVSSPITAIFKHKELRDLAETIKPKVPIIIICQYVLDFKLLSRMWRMAAEIGCERFIFAEGSRKFFSSNLFRGIECSHMKTDFNDSIDEAIDAIDPSYKILVIAPTSTSSNSQAEIDNSHFLGYEDAWETGKVALLIRGKSLPMNGYCGRDMKIIRIQYMKWNTFSSQAYNALFQLMREYRMKNLSLKEKSKKSTRKKSKVL